MLFRHFEIGQTVSYYNNVMKKQNIGTVTNKTGARVWIRWNDDIGSVMYQWYDNKYFHFMDLFDDPPKIIKL
jgi:hypothetical protein